MIGRRTVLGGMALAAAKPAWAQRTGRPSTTLRMIHGSNLASFDPIWTTAPATNDFAMMVYDQLVAVDENYIARPQMAEGWAVEDGGRGVVFTLRQGLFFHDGEPVRSGDCIASIARWSVRDSFGQIVAGFTDSMEAIDDRSFRIRLRRPFPLLPDAIGKANSSQCVMMPKRFAETDPMLQIAEPIGSGPYRFLKDEWAPGAFAAFARFDKYAPRQEPVSGLAGGRAPKIDRMEWSFTADAATALAAMQAGEQDYWDSPVPDLIPVIRGNPDLVVKTRGVAGIYYALVMNHLHPPFDNPATRQALAMAIDQDDFVRAASGDQPDSAGHCASFYMCGTRYASDAGGGVLSERSVDKARTALKASGYAGEKTVRSARDRRHRASGRPAAAPCRLQRGYRHD
jgi:peptide/nickel transport system substrate-binding protein